MRPRYYVQLLTRNLSGEIVDTLGTFGTAILDGRRSLTMMEVWGHELAQREQRAGKDIVGFEIRHGGISRDYRVVRRIYVSGDSQ